MRGTEFNELRAFQSRSNRRASCAAPRPGGLASGPQPTIVALKSGWGCACQSHLRVSCGTAEAGRADCPRRARAPAS